MAKKNAFTPIFSIREVIFPIFVEDAGGRCSAPEGHLRGRPALSGHSGGRARSGPGAWPGPDKERPTAEGRNATRGGKRSAATPHEAGNDRQWRATMQYLPPVPVYISRLYIGRRIPGPGAATLEKSGTITLGKPGTATLEKSGTAILEKSGTAILEKPGTATLGKPGTTMLEKPGTTMLEKSGTAILEKPGTATLSPGPQCRKILKTVRFSFS